MEKLNIVCWHWGDRYPAEYVNRLAYGVRRNLRRPHRVIAISEEGKVRGDGFESFAMKDASLLATPKLSAGCIVRMRLFDPERQAELGIKKGERVVNIDIDTIVTGQLDKLFDRPEPFVILQNINTTNPNPYNGSLWMVRAGDRPDVWRDFSIEALNKLPHHAYPSEQDWMRHKLPNAAAWGPRNGVYGFKKKGWPEGSRRLPADAKIVTFPGRDPGKYVEVDWVKRHWLAA